MNLIQSSILYEVVIYHIPDFPRKVAKYKMNKTVETVIQMETNLRSAIFKQLPLHM